MELLLLLPLLSLVTCAPLGENANPLEGLEDIDTKVKRAQEVAMFNEQNAPHETAKRSGPADLDEGPIDLTGGVKANEPTDIKEAESKSGEIDEPESADIESEVADIEEPVGENLDTEENPDQSAENEFSSEEIVEQLAGDDASTELEENSKADESNFDDEEGTEDYLTSYNQMLGRLANQPYPDKQWGPLYDNPGLFGLPTRSRYQRFRRSQNRRFNNVPLLRRAVKRNRRIKRDLFYPGTALQSEYDPYEESYLYDPYETYQTTGNELLDLLDAARQYDDENYGNYLGNGYEWPEESLDDLVYEDEPKYFVPKRQAGLSFVPGIKRSRPFYPYYEEPKTHFSAFVPKKRSWNDYENEYERVMRLAAALRDAQSEYPEDYGYGLYRRRK